MEYLDPLDIPLAPGQLRAMRESVYDETLPRETRELLDGVVRVLEDHAPKPLVHHVGSFAEQAAGTSSTPMHLYQLEERFGDQLEEYPRILVSLLMGTPHVIWNDKAQTPEPLETYAVIDEAELALQIGEELRDPSSRGGSPEALAHARAAGLVQLLETRGYALNRGPAPLLSDLAERVQENAHSTTDRATLSHINLATGETREISFTGLQQLPGYGSEASSYLRLIDLLSRGYVVIDRHPAPTESVRVTDRDGLIRQAVAHMQTNRGRELSQLAGLKDSDLSRIPERSHRPTGSPAGPPPATDPGAL